MIARTAGNDLWQPQDAYERHVRAVPQRQHGVAG